MKTQAVPPSEPGRRRWLTAGVGAAALAAGGGLAWWQMREKGEAEAAPAGFWDQQFDGPSGAPVRLAMLKGRPLLLNFWATWCPPCIEEMPLLDQFSRERAKAWNVLGLAIDQPSAVRKYLERVPVSYPIGMAGLGGTELAKTLGNRAGGLPFTVVFAPDGAIRQRRMGRLTANDLALWAGV